MTANRADFEVRDEGSLVLLVPVTEAARTWADVHIGKDNGYQPLWPTVLVEKRYVAEILTGIQGDGLEVEL